VLLHDHLDGGLRPATLIELAQASGHDGLPRVGPEELGKWFVAKATGRGLAGYLTGFVHTVAVMQTEEALARIAFECVEDLAADGVVYAEVRFAPELHTKGGLSMASATEAVLGGLRSAASKALVSDRTITVRLLLSAMRHKGRSLEVAKTAVRYGDSGVVGFDLAGPEEGHPASAHLAAFRLARQAGLHTTAHAGEASGPDSVREAVQVCGAERVGHGVSVVSDIDPAVTVGSLDVSVDTGQGGQGGQGGQACLAEDALGPTARYLRDRQIPLEVCPTSNLQTGVANSLAEHPLGLLYRLGFRVTLNTDNRLMSGVSLSAEMAACAQVFHWGWPDLKRLSLNAVEGAFCGEAERKALGAELARYYGTLEAGEGCG
jgi:adenosine deaminase